LDTGAITDPYTAAAFDPAVDTEASLCSGGHCAGDLSIDLEPGLSTAGYDTANGRHGDIEHHVADHEVRPRPSGLRKVFI
jgi:hypothetical protein